MAKQGRDRPYLWTIFILALALRLGYVAATTGFTETPPFDWREYVHIATHLLEQGTMVSPMITEKTPTEPSALMPPAYGAFVALVYNLFGLESPLSTAILRILNCLASAALVFPTYWLAAGLGGTRSARLAIVAVTIHPILNAYCSYIWDICPFYLVVTLTVYIAWRLGNKPLTVLRLFLFGLWLGAVALLNPALTLTYPLLVLWPITRQVGYNPVAASRYILPAILGWALAISPWIARNYAHFDAPIYVRSGFEQELWLGVCPQADSAPHMVYDEQFPLRNPAMQDHISKIGERAYLAECGKKARTAIREDPVRLVRLIGWRALDYWAGTLFTRADPETYVIYRNWRGLLGAVAQTALTLAFIYVLLFRRKQMRGTGWMAGAVVVFSLIYCLTHVQSRFRGPMEPTMIVVVCVALFRDREDQHESQT